MKNGLGFQTAMGSMNHVAFNVHKKDILEYRKRIRKSGMSPYVSPMLYHADGVEGGFVFDAKDDRISWRSFYFFGPDGVKNASRSFLGIHFMTFSGYLDIFGYLDVRGLPQHLI